MEGYGLAALAPLATVYPSPPSGGKGDTGVLGRGTKGIATANLQIELPEFDPKNLPEWAEEFSEFLLLKPVRTPVAIWGSLGVCIYVPASRHWLISYSPIHLN